MELVLGSLGQLIPIYSGVINSVSAVFGLKESLFDGFSNLSLLY
jgi:hypothetical protein